ncbi:MAG TPA: SMI1/KNR4 family protein [Tepidisphaeraceae bacterium]|nr:SMI1/KNR4 family protein [Tepidisphaeraceae bacterium]
MALEMPAHTTGFQLLKPGLNEQRLVTFEESLDVRLPTSFRSLITQYEFGNLSIGWVNFGTNERYDLELMAWNKPEKPYVPWWGTGVRPSKYLLIANSDAYNIFVDLTDGCITAAPRDAFWSTARLVAKDFSTFVRAVGTLYLDATSNNLDSFVQSIVVEVGGTDGSSFWFDAASGYS